MRRTRREMIALAAALGLGAAACGAPPSQGEFLGGGGSDVLETYRSFDRMAESKRHEALVEAAREEGEVVAYLRADVAGPKIEKAFEAAYGIDLKILNPGRTTVVRQQLLEQAKARKLRADIVETHVPELETIYAETGLVAPMPDFVKKASGKAHTTHSVESFQYPFLPAWNTDAVKKAPRSYEDFLDAHLDGRLVMVTSNELWYKGLFEQLTGKGMTPEEFTDLFRKIAARSRIAESSNPAANALASGQHRAAVNVVLVTVQKLAGSPPVAYTPPVEPVILSPAGVGLLRQAPHPAAAMLFAQWYLTEGQKYIAEEQFIEGSPYETDLQGAVMARVRSDDLNSQRYEEWRVAYDNLLHGREDVLPAYVRGKVRTP